MLEEQKPSVLEGKRLYSEGPIVSRFLGQHMARIDNLISDSSKPCPISLENQSVIDTRTSLSDYLGQQWLKPEPAKAGNEQDIKIREVSAIALISLLHSLLHLFTLKNSFLRIFYSREDIFCNFFNKLVAPERIINIIVDYSNMLKVKGNISFIR